MGAEKYRRNAQRCLDRAQEMIDPENRATMIDLAASWIRLAEQTEENIRQLPWPLTEPDKPAAQQQQQIQPKKDDGGK